MKIKKIILLAVLALFISSSMQGQGIYNSSKEKKVPPKGTTTNGGGIYRAPGDPDGGIGDDDTTPIGDGLLVLTLMAGGYFIAKSRKIRKNEV
jgi:hypothetical protein